METLWLYVHTQLAVVFSACPWKQLEKQKHTESFTDKVLLTDDCIAKQMHLIYKVATPQAEKFPKFARKFFHIEIQ